MNQTTINQILEKKDDFLNNNLILKESEIKCLGKFFDTSDYNINNWHWTFHKYTTSGWKCETENGNTCPIVLDTEFNKNIITSARNINLTILKKNRFKQTITMLDWLKNFGKYNPKYNKLDLSLGNNNEDVILRFQTIIVPMNSNSKYTKIIPKCYSYNTVTSNQPQNIVAISNFQGITQKLDSSGKVSLYHVINNNKINKKVPLCIYNSKNKIDIKNRTKLIQIPIVKRNTNLYNQEKFSRNKNLLPVVTIVSFYPILDDFDKDDIRNIKLHYDNLMKKKIF